MDQAQLVSITERIKSTREAQSTAFTKQTADHFTWLSEVVPTIKAALQASSSFQPTS
jgi:hypothetical protein